MEEQRPYATDISEPVMQLLERRQGHRLDVPYDTMENCYRSRAVRLANYECDGDCGTDTDGEGVCFDDD